MTATSERTVSGVSVPAHHRSTVHPAMLQPANPYAPIEHTYPEDIDEAHDEIRRLVSQLQQANITISRTGTSLQELKRVRQAERREYEQALDEEHAQHRLETELLRSENDKLYAKVDALLYLLGEHPEPVEPRAAGESQLPATRCAPIGTGWRALSAGRNDKPGAAA